MENIQEKILRISKQIEDANFPSSYEKMAKKELKKLEKQVEFQKLGWVEVSSCEDLQKLITKYRKEPAYRSVCKFKIPAPNKMGETIYGSIFSGWDSTDIKLRLKNKKEWIDPDANLSKGEGVSFAIAVQNRGDLQERDEDLFRHFKREIFGDYLGNQKIKVKSSLSKMVAEIEYEITIPFDREMTDEEKQDFIDRYLERPEIVEKIYQNDNLTTFSWDEEKMDWNSTPTKEVA